MSPFVQLIVSAVVTFFAMWFLMPLFLLIVRLLGFYTIVNEGTCQVFILFGIVVGILREPGLHILPFKIGPGAFLVNWFGSRKGLYAAHYH